MTPDEQERLYKRLCQFETIGQVSESMRRLIEDVWPELVSKRNNPEPQLLASSEWSYVLADEPRVGLANLGVETS
jgi:hypothetical protein